ncbi:NADPH-dependent FMN reductase [Alteribacter aurantiacus]|uniref:NADPH-dependent FMN reductase n=1 Tax=Alteribacter aurantiacus TaxID=254410 RepID=UPI00041896A2|nr:NAD(P)H-dependent oxidoreductase [Alteribacter aurantiacus]
MKVIGICGSLRNNSLNKVVINELKELSSDTFTVEVVSIGDLPLFNGDLEEGGDPSVVHRFKDQLAQADGLLIVSPEYSHGVPGVLKNALDWAGSMTNVNVLDKKPAMVIGASPSAVGTALSQVQIKQTLSACGAYVLPQPEVFIGTAHERIGDGRVTDEDTISILKDVNLKFSNWIKRFLH